MAASDTIRYTPDCRVTVAGKTLDAATQARLVLAEVDRDVELFGRCTLVFNDPALELINGKSFESGTAVTVELGFARNLARVFEGEVVALEPQFRRDKPPSLKVVCLEGLHRLALSQQTRALNGVDDKQIVTKIAQEHGLTGDAAAGTNEHMLQSNVSDALLLRRMAQKRGQYLRIEGKKLILRPPPKGAAITISPGDGVRKMRLFVKSGQQVSEVTAHGWDAKSKREIVARAKAQGVVGEGSTRHGKGTLSMAAWEQPPDVTTAEAIAKGRMERLAERFVTAKVEMIGDARILPDAVITFDKIGDMLDGQFRVSKAVHQFSRRGYFVSFQCVRIARKIPARAQPPAAGKPQPQMAVAVQDEVIEPPHLETDSEVHPPPAPTSPAEVPLEDLEDAAPETEPT